MTISSTDRQKARTWAEHALRTLDAHELSPRLTIEWNARFTSRLGDALYRPVGGVRIRLSKPLWPLADEETRRSTVIHEVCHIVADYQSRLDGRLRPDAHGPEWRALMLRCGERPTTRHNLDTSPVRRRQRRLPARCGCREHEVSVTRANRILRGARYRCRSCGRGVTLLELP